MYRYKITRNEVFEMAKRKLSKKLDCLKMMPPLYHKLPDKNFSFNDSELYAFIKNQPDLIEWVRCVAKDNKFIEYDKSTGKWQGVDYHD